MRTTTDLGALLALLLLSFTGCAPEVEEQPGRFSVPRRVFAGETPLFTVRVASELPLIVPIRAGEFFDMEMRDPWGAAIPILKPDCKRAPLDGCYVRSASEVTYQLGSDATPQTPGVYSLHLEFRPFQRGQGYTLRHDARLECVELGSGAIVHQVALTLATPPGLRGGFEGQAEVLNARDDGRHYLVCRFREPGRPPRVYRIREIDADTRFTVDSEYFEERGFVQRQQLWVTYNRAGKRYLAGLGLYGDVLSEEQLDAAP